MERHGEHVDLRVERLDLGDHRFAVDGLDDGVESKEAERQSPDVDDGGSVAIGPLVAGAVEVLDGLVDAGLAVVADVVVLHRDDVHTGRLHRREESGPPAERKPLDVHRAVVDERRLEVDDGEVGGGDDISGGANGVQEVVAEVADREIGVASGDDVARRDQRANAGGIEVELREVTGREGVGDGQRRDREGRG